MGIMIPFLLLVCFIAMAVGQQEPCEKYVSIVNERRSIRYTSTATEPNICDNDINETVWYRFQVLPPQRIHDRCVEGLKCGTDRPVWLRGDHPTAADPGPKEVDVCSRLNEDCCGDWRGKISVKFCRAPATGDDDYYVYRLKRLPQCDMAYCAGDGDICTKGTVWNPNSKSCTEPRPNITASVFEGPITVGKIVNKTEDGRKFDDFYFACNVRWFNPDTQKKGEQFEVVFTFDGQEVTSVAPKITDGSNLQVKLWSKELKGHVGKTVGCKVRSYWKMLDKLRIDYRVAQGDYFVGIRYSTKKAGPFNSPRIEIDEKSPPLTLYFKSTVPISCPETTSQTSCKFSVIMADIPAKDSLGVLECSITFSGLVSKEKLPTQMIKAQVTPGIKNRLSVLRFRPVNTNPDFFWHKFQMPDISIAINDTSTSGVCWSIGDPHFRTFDGRKYHVFLEGDYVLAKSTKRYFEVHVRHHKCARVTCNCAFAMREGNNVIGVNACTGPNYLPTPITYLRDKNVPGATITRSVNRYTLTMPSKAYIIADYRIHANVSFLNIYLYLNSEDYRLTSGLCGVWNGNRGDDTVIKGTTRMDNSSRPIEFSNSYRLEENESYINGHVRPINCLNISDLLPNICTCEKEKMVTCTAPDGTTVAFDTKFTEHCNMQNRTVPPARKRRDVDSSNWKNGEENRLKDMMITEADIPMPEFDEKHGVNVTPVWPTLSGITKAQAEQRCQTKMESSPVYHMCKDRIGQNNETIVENCVIDVQLMDDLIVAESIASELQTICVHHLEISVVSNGSSLPTEMEVFMANVMSMICPNQCSGNGNCRNGTCLCNNGFAGEDCSVNARKPPQLKAFRKNTTCDFRSSFCLETSIFASNFFHSERLSCKVSAVDHAPHFTFRGSPVSTGEVVCMLPAVYRFTSETAAEADRQALNIPAAPFYRWDISLTNDGSLYSNSLRLTVYDSKCQQCGPDGTCTQKPHTCVIEGRCFQSDEVSRINPCNKCTPSKSPNNWTHDGKGHVCCATALSYSISILAGILIAIFGIDA